MNTVKKRKVQEIQIPRINKIKKYDEIKKYNKPKEIVNSSGVLGVDIMKVLKAMVYIGIFMIAAMSQMMVTYSVSNLIVKKKILEENVKKIKAEVDTLESTFISKFDLKNVEKKSIEMGFINNDKVEYIKVKK